MSIPTAVIPRQWTFVSGRCDECGKWFTITLAATQDAATAAPARFCSMECRRASKRQRRLINRETSVLKPCTGCGVGTFSAVCCDTCFGRAVATCLSKRRRGTDPGSNAYSCVICRGYHSTTKLKDTFTTQHRWEMQRLAPHYKTLKAQKERISRHSATMHLIRGGRNTSLPIQQKDRAR